MIEQPRNGGKRIMDRMRNVAITLVVLGGAFTMLANFFQFPAKVKANEVAITGNRDAIGNVKKTVIALEHMQLEQRHQLSSIQKDIGHVREFTAQTNDYMKERIETIENTVGKILYEVRRDNRTS